MFLGITRTAFDAIILMDNNGDISFWNEAAERIFGYSPPEVMGKNLHFLLSTKKIRKGKTLEFKHLRKTGEGPIVVGTRQELFARKKNGDEFPIEISLSSVKVHDTWNEIVIIRDITERKLAEEQRVLLSEIVQSSNDAILGLDPSGTIISWNSGATKIYGYSSDEIIGENISILIPPDRKRQEEAMILEKIRNDERLENFQTIRITKAGDKRYIELSLSPLKNEDGETTGASVIGRDVTKEKKMARTMLSYITVAALRLKNPVELMRDNLISLLDLVDVLDPIDADIDEVMLQLEQQIKYSEQIIHNLRELNQAIIGSFEEEMPDSYRTFFSE